MTDKEALVALLVKWGVPFTDDCQGFSGDWNKGIDSAVRVTASSKSYDASNRPKNWGYEGFYTEFYFDGAGSFTAIGVWE